VVIVLYPESDSSKAILSGGNGNVEIDDAVLEIQPRRISDTSRFIIGDVPLQGSPHPGVGGTYLFANSSQLFPDCPQAQK
jgi:hypothetical protein